MDTFLGDVMAGGIAGLCEAVLCHPLDTIKVRMQLRNKHSLKKMNFISVALNIIEKEKILALYKGLGAVATGIIPKMAIRFSSFEIYKDALGPSMPVPFSNFLGRLTSFYRINQF